MKARYFNSFISTLIILTGCSTEVATTSKPVPSSSTTAITTPPANSGSASGTGSGVNFNVNIDEAIFSSDTDLTAKVFNAEQVDMLNSSSRCKVSFDQATRKDTITCLSGTAYKSSPEVFTFKLKEINNQLTVKSTSVKAGETYRLEISGKYLDGCNTASTTAENKAESNSVNIDNIEWTVSQINCIRS